MVQTLFDFDLRHVYRRHDITGKAAINFPHPGCTTGGWHFLSYFDREAGGAKVSLAGIHYPDTDAFFGDAGNVCIGPRGGRYCITSGGNKRYGI